MDKPTGDTFRGQINFEQLEKFSIKSFRSIRHVDGTNSDDRMIGCPVAGDNLAHLGILHGDILIVRLSENRKENSLCVFDTPNGRTAKFAYENFGDIVLHNKAEWLQTWKIDEAKMIGVVVRVERDLEAKNA